MIRVATKDDCTKIYGLIVDMRNENLDYKCFEQIYYMQCNDCNYIHFVYTEDNTVVGVLVLRLEYQLHHAARVAEIMELAVYGNNRSKGIGKQLVSQAKKYAASNNCVILEVASGKDRIDAHRFYENNSFIRSHAKFAYALDSAQRKL